MAVNPIPDGYHTLTPYLATDEIDRFVDFLKIAFGAVENQRVPGQGGRTGHANVTIGDSPIMMGRGQEAFPASSCMLYAYVPDTDATHLQALVVGATPVQGPAGMSRRPQRRRAGPGRQHLVDRHAPG